MKKTLITYKTWRQTHNPWAGNNFIGNLNPEYSTDANLIDEIHSYIDEYFNPRILGVTDPDRFMILMHAKLAGIESNFFNSFTLDKNYEHLNSMLKNIDMHSLTNTDTNLSGTNNGTTTNLRTDNLTTTKSSREDSSGGTGKTTDNLGARSDTRDIVNGGKLIKDTINGGTITEDTINGGTVTKANEYGADVKTDTTQYGKINTQSGTDTTTNTGTSTSNARAINSQTPQSNIGSGIVGIDAQVDWNYASALQDNKNSQTSNSTNKLEHGLKDTASGTDTLTSNRQARTDNETTTDARTVKNTTTDARTINDTTEDTRTVMESIDTGEQTNISNSTVSSTFTEGEQSVKNTGTQNNTQTEDRTHTQIGTYKKNNDNEGRTDNIAVIWEQWRALLHKTMSAYTYLFNQLDSLFVSIWDIDDDCYFNII